jgi:hypothetical protein
MNTWPSKAKTREERKNDVARIRSIEIRQVDLTPPGVRTDAILSFVKQ